MAENEMEKKVEINGVEIDGETWTNIEKTRAE